MAQGEALHKPSNKQPLDEDCCPTCPVVVSCPLCLICTGLFIYLYILFARHMLEVEKRNNTIPFPVIELASMEFTVLNITETHLSAKWDMSIRIPYDLPGYYICLQGDLQTSLFYKNVILATSSPQKYNDLHYRMPQLLSVSAVASGKEISSLIGKDIIKDIKTERKVRFKSHLSLTDCETGATGKMKFACNEATLRFNPGSDMKAVVAGNHPTCKYFD